MISVGVDVSKGKSTICVLKPYGEIVCSPFEVLHVEKELEGLDNLLQKLDGEIRIVFSSGKRLLCIGGESLRNEEICEGQQYQGSQDRSS